MKKLILSIFPLMLMADTGQLLKILDGHTFEFLIKGKQQICRAAYISAPEKTYNSIAKKQHKQCPEVDMLDMPDAGKGAAAYASKLLSVGNSYDIRVRGADQSGRNVCIIQLESQKTFNLQMIRDGYALPLWKAIPPMQKRKYGPARNSAKRSKKGLWNTHARVMECLEK